jgi:hypothetical protein
MTKQILNIEIGKNYPASYVLNEIRNFSSRIQIGHAIIKVNGVDKHLYSFDIDENKLKSLKNTELKVLSIINPCEQNFAHKLIMSSETQENLKKIEENKSLSYAFDMNDLMQAGYKFKGMTCAVNCFNCVFKKNELTFIASKYSEGTIDRKHFVKISYKPINNENINKKCDILEEK